MSSTEASALSNMILSTNFSEVFLLIPSTSSADNASSLAVLLSFASTT